MKTQWDFDAESINPAIVSWQDSNRTELVYRFRRAAVAKEEFMKIRQTRKGKKVSNQERDIYAEWRRAVAEAKGISKALGVEM